MLFSGGFSPGVFLKTEAIVVTITITVIYFIAQHYGHEAKVAWISACAEHYPQFLLFRVATITGAALVILGWLTNHFFLKTIAIEHGINLKPYQPQIELVMGIMGGLFLTMSTGLLDTGRHNPKVHGFCATAFFSFTFFAMVYNTFISWTLQNMTREFNTFVLTVKTIVTGVMICLFFLNFYAQAGAFQSKVGSKMGIYIEWASAYCVCLYFYCMAKDLKKFSFEYEILPESRP